MKMFVWLLAIPCIAQPKWASIATPSSPHQYFRYWGDGSTAHKLEKAKFEAANPHPPYTYRFFNPPAAPRSVCTLKDRRGVYWYSPEGAHLAGTLVTPNPSEFSVSALQTGIQGFGVTAQFAGDAKETGAIEVAYFTDRVCSDAGVEYGFSRDLATDSILVYWSTFANCGNDATGICRKTDDPASGSDYKNIQQENGGTSSEHGFRIYGLTPSAEYTYKTFVDNRALRVEVSRHGHIAQCSETPTAPLIDCAFTKTPGSWFPIGRLTSGHIVTGTQTVGNPGIAKESGFKVSDTLVAR
jgi:hypothetical protein